MAASMFQWFGKKLRIFKSFYKTKVFVFGDSHTEIFQHLNSQIYNQKFYFTVCLVGGATAQGLRNPNSKTNAVEIFKKRLLTIKNKKRLLIFSLGEVDTGFIIWFRAEKHNDSVENQMNESLSAYFSFIEWVKSQGFNNMGLLSAPPPTIEDNQEWGTVANQRKEVKASKLERTQLTIRYNLRLKEFCEKNGILFIDCDSHLLAQNGLVKNEFLNSDKTNHHLDIAKYSRVVFNILKNEL
jgi:hypothetical protein